MKKPILVVMAAGMGSRYGGLKQMDPVGPSGEVILDYSVYDAKRAGFETVVFIIKHEIEKAFKERIGSKIEKYMNVFYAFQEVNDVPNGFIVPEGRIKPWGTGHAILSAKELVDAPFAIINSDDYYGIDCFKTIYNYLNEHRNDSEYCMVGYLVKNTVSENGSVTRGVCEEEDGYLTSIREQSGIEKYEKQIRCPNGESWEILPENTLVSMNLWGFQPGLMDVLQKGFSEFLGKEVPNNPLKAEYLIPTVVQDLIKKGQIKVKVLSSRDKWFGVTYKEDKPIVVKSIKDKVDANIYPLELWK